MPPADTMPTVAVVSACRNELRVVEGLVEALVGLEYPAERMQIIVVDDGSDDGTSELLDEIAAREPRLSVIHRRPGEGGGKSGALNRALEQITSSIVVVYDADHRPRPDSLRRLVRHFDDPTVGLAGGWGVTSTDGRQFEDAPPGEVDAIEGYCLAVRREALQSVRGFDRRFRFYRNADLDFSFAVRDAGWRAVRTEPLPAERHEHRGWTAHSDEERDRLSRRNFYRFLDRWRDRPDLLLANRSR